jgi:hypothetical protein
MYSLINTIKDIKSISINDIRELFVYKNNEIYDGTKLLYVGGKYLFANNLNEEYFNYGDKVKKFLFKNNDQLFLEDYIANSLNNEGVILFKNKEINENIVQDYYYLNFKTNEEILLLKKYSGSFILNYSENTKSIFTSNNNLLSISLLSGEFDWELNLDEEISILQANGIQKIVGIYNNVLWVSCTKALWGIDINTGIKLYAYTKPTEIAYNSGGTLDFFRGYDGYIDEENKKIIGFEHETFYELDLTDLSLKYWILTSECNKIAVYAPHIGKKLYTGTYIYFIDNINGKIIIFNRITKNFDWIYSFPSESCTGILNDIQISKNKLYVLDTGGTLHIFKKN